MVIGILLLPLVLWLVFLFMASQSVREKIKVPDSGTGKVLVCAIAILLILGYVSGRFLYGQTLYHFTPFLFLLTALLLIYNTKIYGFTVSGIGFLLNGVVMLANGFRMPLLGHEYRVYESAVHTPMTEKTALFFLGDCIVISFSERILAFSIGDILIVAGFLIAIIHLTFVFVEEHNMS